LTLNTHAFTHTRMRLSQCWDQVKEADKERKKVRNQLKVTFKLNYDKLHEQIETLRSNFEAGKIALHDAQKEIDAIQASMRQMEISHEDLIQLREEIKGARQPILEKLKAAEQEKLQQVIERENVRKKAVQDVFESCEELIKRADSLDVDAL